MKAGIPMNVSAFLKSASESHLLQFSSKRYSHARQKNRLVLHQETKVERRKRGTGLISLD